MSFFDKIKTAVLGNPVFKEYELGKHVCSAGPGLLWRVHDGVKKTTKQEVSLFVFFKKVPTFDKLPKKERAAILEMLKKGPTHLAKLKHPQLLRVEHAIVESSDCVAFVTEPVFCSLANVLGDYENLPTPLPLCIKEHQFHPVEVKYGLLQLAEGLSFLHNRASLFHGNLTPENVIINRKGEWKLAGFNFCCYSQYTSSAQTSFQFQEYDTGKPLHTQPNLDYLAPEYILEKSCTTQSDMYSMGMLIYGIYNQGRPLFENRNNLLSYKRNIEQVSRITNAILGAVPEEIKDSVRAMLSVEPAVRIESLQMTKATFFDDPLITALHTLDGLCKQPDIVKSQFYKTLHQTITQLPRRIVIQKVFPVLAEEFYHNIMIPFVLPNVLLIAEESSIQEYSTLILPALRPVFTVQNPIQVPLILLHRMDLLLKKSTPSEVKEHLLPMIVGALNSTDHDVQELCISVLPTFAGSIDYTSLKHSIIPLIMSLIMSTPYLSVRVKSLVSIGSMMDILDKHIILNQVMPGVCEMDSNEPGVLMAILGICHGALQRQKLGFDKDYLATKVLPFLIPKSTQPTLNVSQFNKFMTVIRDMLTKIQTDHKEFLAHNETMQEQMRSTVQLSQDVKEAKKMADVTSGIEAMSNSNQDTSVSVRRGATVSSPPATVVQNDSSTSSNSGVDWLSSLTDVNIFVPQESSSSAAGGSSLFAGLSVRDTVPSQTSSTSLLTTATVSSRPSENTTNFSNTNTSILTPQSSTSVTSNWAMASVTRVPSNTTYQPISSSSSRILQPQVTTSVTRSQPISAASGPTLGAASTQLSSSTPLQPKPATSLYNNTSTAYQPPPVVNSNTLQPNKAPVVNAKNPPVTEPPPPYPGDEKYAAATARFRTASQQPALVPSVKPNLSQRTAGSTLHSNINSSTQSPPSAVPSSFRTDTLQPQPSLLQSAQPAVNPQMSGSTGVQPSTRSPTSFATSMLKPQIAGSTGTQTSSLNPTMGTNILQPQAAGFTGMQPSSHNPNMGTNILQPQNTGMQLSSHNPTSFGANILQPRQPNVLMSTTQPASTVAMPQATGTANIQPSFNNVTQLPMSHPQQMYGAPMQAASNFGNPTAQSGTVLVPQKASMAPTPSAGTSYAGNIGTMNTTSNGLFQQPLIAGPPAQQGTSYGNMMSPGANPFSDINDLL